MSKRQYLCIFVQKYAFLVISWYFLLWRHRWRHPKIFNLPYFHLPQVDCTRKWKKKMLFLCKTSRYCCNNHGLWGAVERCRPLLGNGVVRSQISKFLKKIFAMSLLSWRVNDSPKISRIERKDVFLMHPNIHIHVAAFKRFLDQSHNSERV